MKSHYQVAVIGAGTAGIMTAAQLRKENPWLNIVIIDPADKHYYQPAFTLVGAGTYDMDDTVKPMKDLIPSGVEWIQKPVTGFKPDENKVIVEGNQDIGYDFLVVAPGVVYDNSMIEGLQEAFDRGVACSNYTDPEYTWKAVQNIRGGTALFTQPATPIKCGGAPQKVMYLASDYLRKQDLLSKTNVVFATPGTVIFGVKKIAKTLNEVIDRYGIHTRYYYAPFKIDSDNKVAYFKNSAPSADVNSFMEDSPFGERAVEDDVVEIPFDFLHLAPPQRAPDFIRESTLVNDAGWVEVDHHSMQHVKYPNIFSLGDVAALPTAKTGAAIRKQVPVVVENILRLEAHQAASNKSYQGYSSCPLVTGYGKMVLAEFDYDNNFTPDPKLKQMLVFNSAKEHWRLWLLKKYMLPYMYWNKMLKGKNV